MAGIITSEFLGKSNESNARVMASVPFEHDIAYFDPQNLLKLFSNSSTSFPNIKLFLFMTFLIELRILFRILKSDL